MWAASTVAVLRVKVLSALTFDRSAEYIDLMSNETKPCYYAFLAILVHCQPKFDVVTLE